MISSGQRILVVDGLSETTEVLKAVFEPRGHRVNRIRQTQLAQAAESQPSVVVWHERYAEESASRLQFGNVPQIVIGRARITSTSSFARHLPSPFQYGELLQAIESALQSSAAVV